MGFQLSFASIKCTVTGEGHYQKSGIAGDSWETATETGNWSFSPFPVSKSDQNDFRYNIDKPNTVVSVYSVMHSIENHTVLYDNTWLGTNHQWEPMHPTSLKLEMQIYPYSPKGYMQGDITDPLNTSSPFYIYNEPDYALWNGQWYAFNADFIRTHNGSASVYLAGNDMNVFINHSDGKRYGFYNGGTLTRRGDYVNGRNMEYTLSTGQQLRTETARGRSPYPSREDTATPPRGREEQAT